LPGSGNTFSSIEVFTQILPAALFGGTGNDTIIGGSTSDTIQDDGGNNLLIGGGGDDLIQTFGTGSDTLIGGTGSDFLDESFGGGNDSLSGEDGADTLVGGTGNDTLTGGTGADAFRFNFPAEGIDTITDFVVGTDAIQFDAFNFGLFEFGTLAASRFGSGAGVTSATTADQRFIFNTTTRGLFFDVDGVGGSASVAIATLNTAITNTAITLI